MFSDVYKAASSEKQVLMLLSVSHNLTIGAREAYPKASDGFSLDERFAILHDINELQHKITGQSIHLLSGEERRYPDEVICGMLRPDVQELPVVAKALSWALVESVKAARSINP